MESQKYPNTETLGRVPHLFVPQVLFSTKSFLTGLLYKLNRLICAMHLRQCLACSTSSNPAPHGAVLPLTVRQPLSSVLEGPLQTKHNSCPPGTKILVQQVRHTHKHKIGT